ncbi:MAG: hypothetical protein ACRD0U_01810 [Acidimicrobiales bacterium]
MGELLSRSTWIAGRPGLGQAAAGWLQDLPAQREARARRAAAMARPSLEPASVVAAVRSGYRMAATAGFGALNDLLAAAGRVLRFGRNHLPFGGHAPSSQDKLRRTRSVEQAELLVRAGGPAYIKLGQFIATARGLHPDEWVDAFAWCRDEVPPMPAGTYPAEMAATVAGADPSGW